MAKHPRVDMPSSKLKIEMSRILKEEGYISTYKVVDEKGKKTLRVFLHYTPERPSVITDLKRISRPGSRRYVGNDGHSPRRRRHGHHHSDHATRLDDWPVGAQRRRRRRTCFAKSGKRGFQ